MKSPLLLAFALSATTWAGSSERIRLSQVGFAIDHPKIAIVLDAAASADLVDSSTGSSVFHGSLGPAVRWASAEDTGRIFDFSTFNQAGTYFVVAGSETSHPVRILANPFQDLTRASIKAFWYNRSSYALPAEFAGTWARPEGHPDTAVRVHASAASADRPAGTLMRSPGGWYDAGDYGKYIVNSGISTWTLLHLYESTPGFSDTLSLHVPKHAGPASDLADEILWNLRWMLSMQDPVDGGVYHKLTTAVFSKFIMPAADTAPRYVVQKSTAAALNLAAVAATAARVFANIPELAGLVDSCRFSALSAWTWARRNPENYYDQDTLNAHFKPGIGTGTYGNSDVSDEFLWAASELFLATGADSFALSQDLSGAIESTSSWTWPSWDGVSALGWIDLLGHSSRLSGSLAGTEASLKSSLQRTANSIRNVRKSNGYRIPSGGFWWGGNAAFANNGMLLWETWKATGDTSYLVASLDVLDYLTGRNATGYSFVTGFGSKPPMHPHHRPSAADSVKDPVPGFLVGGPNSGQEDHCVDYPSDLGPKSYLDEQGCYAVNEVAINWNAPMAFLSGVWSARLSQPNVAVRPTGSKLPAGLAWNRSGHVLQASLGGKPLSRLDLVTAEGRLLATASGPSASLSVPVAGHGLGFLRAKTTDGNWVTARVVLP